MNNIEIDWSNYESPISINYIMREQEKQIEKDVLKVIASYNINVDADELVKALQYDRNQYEKGYKAGFHDAQQVKHGKWEWEPGYVGTTAKCSVCGLSPMGFYSLPIIQIGRLPEYPFCPKCGAKMDESDNGAWIKRRSIRIEKSNQSMR